jgi:hypothetical protein
MPPNKEECEDCDRYACEGCPLEDIPEPIDFGDDERVWGYDGDCL